MKPGDRLITGLVGEHHTGETFREWPLHVTVVAWFRGGPDTTELARLLEQSLTGVAPFEVVMGEEARLGYQGRAVVNLVRLPSPFTEVQKRTVETLESAAIDIVAGTGTWGGSYKPHITVQRSGRLHAGDTFMCDRLFIVSQAGSHKAIDAEVVLP